MNDAILAESEPSDRSQEEKSSSSLKDIKQEFYEWCGLLSIDEIASNAPLLKSIERLERMLLAAGA